VKRADRDWDFTIDATGTESRKSSWDNLNEEKEKARAQAAVSSKKDKPRKVVGREDPLETFESHHERDHEETEEPVAGERGKRPHRGLAVPLRKQAVDSEYRIRFEMYNVSIPFFHFSTLSTSRVSDRTVYWLRP
jgi:hypothetical protein